MRPGKGSQRPTHTRPEETGAQGAEGEPGTGVRCLGARGINPGSGCGRPHARCNHLC